ncbi:CHAP domain-containing protein, partial [Myroides sp. WP-1]|uniref:CHAP domain-containing protein n=1 Tax=Myroides sp. WP-1 TaxID=2759944 RepID=UPI0015FE29E6
GLTKDVAWLTTVDMVSEEAFLKNDSYKKLLNEGCSIEHVDGKDGVFDPNFEPQPGDIFVWRRLKPGRTKEDGHTGIVYTYDKTTKIVTILEALTESGDMDTHINTKFSILTSKERNEIKDSGSENNKTRVSYYQLKGGALQIHTGWKGYFRPKGYHKIL